MALLSYEFMRRAFLAAIFIAGIAPMLGVFLVIRRQSLMADTLSHVSLAGVALGFFLNLNPSLTTLLIVVIAAIILEYLRTLYRSYSEISIAILMSGGLALALVLMNLSGGTPQRVSIVFVWFNCYDHTRTSLDLRLFVFSRFCFIFLIQTAHVHFDL